MFKHIYGFSLLFINRNNEIETLVDCSALLDSQIIII